jgi:hypothetical protein
MHRVAFFASNVFRAFYGEAGGRLHCEMSREKRKLISTNVSLGGRQKDEVRSKHQRIIEYDCLQGQFHL